MAKEVYLVADLDLIAIASQPISLRAVSDNQEVNVVANDLQEVGRPDRVLDSFLRPKPAHDADQPALFGQAQFIQERFGGGMTRFGGPNAVGNNCELLSRQTVPNVEILHARAVGNDSRGPPGQVSVDPEVAASLPGIDRLRDELEANGIVLEVHSQPLIPLS